MPGTLVQPSGCRASCQHDDTRPWRNVQWVTRLRDFCIAYVWIATARQKTDGASVALAGLHLKNTPPFLGLRGPPGRLPQAVLPRPLRGLCRCAAAVSQAIHGTAAVRCQSMTDALSSRNRSPIDHDGQRANCGDRRLISGCRRSSSLQMVPSPLPDGA